MVVEAGLPAIGTIVAAAIVDSINPCAIGVMILLVSLMVVSAKLRAKMAYYCGIYIAAVYVTYLAAGLGLTLFFHAIPLWAAEYISIIVGALIVAGSLIEIKDFYWYGEGVSLAIPPERVKDIEKKVQHVTVAGLAALGAFVAGVELPCTGGPYLAITLLLSQNFNFTAFLLLVFYNLIFVAPLILVLVAAMMGVRMQDMKMWKHKNRPYMRLAMGVLLIGLGWLLMLIANGTVNLG